MYLPKSKNVVKDNPLKIKMSRKYLFAIGNMVVVGGMLLGYNAVQYIQGRKRTSDTRLGASRTGKRVIIVGGGASGCAVASLLTSQDPTLQVTVFEPNHLSRLESMVPYAHAGHRSYDLRTHESGDSLFSTTAWNVVRDSKLVFRSVDRVFPETNMLVDSDGHEHPYDCLVVASGTHGDLRAVPGLSPTDFNKYRIATEPGVTRDTLANSFDGAIVHAKVGPRAPETLFAEALRDDSTNPRSGTPIKHDSTRSWWQRLLWRRATNSSEMQSTVAAADALTTLPNLSNSESLVPFATGKQHCGTFISTTNLLWKYLNYFNKTRCPLIAVSEERLPADDLPSPYNDIILEFWKQRAVEFHPSTKLAQVNPREHSCVLRDMQKGSEDAETKVDYRLLILDLPRVAGSWIAKSGLSEPKSAGFLCVDPTTLQHRTYKNVFGIGDCTDMPTVRSYGACFTQAPIVSHNVRQFLSNKKLTAKYDGYSSFNIVMTTWRHMWPEMSWRVPGGDIPSEGATSSSQPYELVRRNEHIWDNTKWRDIRGLLQGVYVQWFGLETMHWFVFMRGNWYPPQWFELPSFPDDA